VKSCVKCGHSGQAVEFERDDVTTYGFVCFDREACKRRRAADPLSEPELGCLDRGPDGE
jgi:hypothetical protein